MSQAAMIESNEDHQLQEAFRGGMRRLASGIAIVTTKWEGRHFGLVATAVCSVSMEPPTLLVAINHSASPHAAIVASRIMCINIIGEERRDLIELFSDPSRRAERFHGTFWHAGVTGSPVLQGALAAFDCRIVQTLCHGTHTIFLGGVVDVAMTGNGANPVVHFDRRLTTIR